MSRGVESGSRAIGLFVALFAVTLNFLQPLAHAALMREARPSTVWAVLCNGAPSTDVAQNGGTGEARQQHECCLGLAHAVTIAAPAAGYVLLAPLVTVERRLLPVEQPGEAAIRDGPSRTRGPPFIV